MEEVVKKVWNWTIAIMLVMVLILGAVPQTVHAEPEVIHYPSGVAAGDWQWTGVGVTGSEAHIDLAATPAPVWLELLASGIQIDGAATICHPFRGGQFGWQGEIRQLVNGQWVRLETTNAWLPDAEGTFTSCAKAPAAGTYALFGYFNGPDPSKQTCAYSTDEWTAGIGDFDLDANLDFSFWLMAANLPAGTQAGYAVLKIDPAGSLTGAMTGTGTKYPADHIWSNFIDFLDYNIAFTPDFSSAVVRFWAAGCVKDFTIGPIDLDMPQ